MNIGILAILLIFLEYTFFYKQLNFSSQALSCLREPSQVSSCLGGC